MVFSASSAFAVSDDAALNADDDITIEEGVLTSEEDVNSPDDVSDDDVLQAAEEDDALRDGDNVVTPENWQKFIDNETKIINYSGEELKFEGNFGPDLNIGNINVNNSIKLTGNNAVMTNISFYIMADDVVMTGFTLIENQNDVAPIIATGVKNVEISNVKLNFTAINDYDGYAIWMNSVDNIRLLNNVISYVGTTVYNESNTNKKFAIFIEESDNALIKGNTFNVNVTSCHVDWPEIPAGSWNWVRTPYCEGIVFDSCDGLEFSENTINLGYNSRSGSDDTIYVLDVLNSDDAVISGNTITALGADHVYGVIVDNADNFTVSDNDINVSSDVHQAIGIDVEGPAAGIIKYNNITAIGTLVNSVYSGMNYKPATVTIGNNSIVAIGYAANAVELGGTFATVEGNAIAAMGNYTATIISTVPNAVIKNNIVMSMGSNEGDAAPGDYYMSKEVVAVKIISGVADISGNNISSDCFGVYAAPGTTLTLSDNEIGVISENVSSSVVSVVSATLNMFNNNISYSAKTVYAGENTTVINGVFVSDSKAAVKGNRFYLTVSSCHVDWPEIPAGSYNWIRTPYSEGIVFDSCDNLEFTDNTISLGYNSRSGSDDTIYVLDVVNSDNVTISGNTIDALGADHIYGIVVENADNFTVCNNDIDVSSDVHQAVGIDVEGPAVGTVIDNNITANGTLVNAVYSGMNWKSATVSIENNTIVAIGYAANAIELGGTFATVEGNAILAKGNYTAAILSTIPNAVIKNNEIISEGSNVGDAAPGDYYMNKEGTAIKIVSGMADISGNNISSNVLGVYAAPYTTVTLSDNEVEVFSDENVSSAVIFADYATLNMFNNNISYSASTVYAGENTTVINGVLVSDSKAVVKGNHFYLTVSSCRVDWPEIPAGSYNWIRTPYSEGIVFDSCDNLEFTDNTISLGYNSRSGLDDTIYVLDVLNSDNVTISGNTIDALGADHVYGIVVENANNFTISTNDIDVSSDVHQAVGIDVEGPAVGVVQYNNITANGTLVNAVYSGMNWKSATVSIENNNIYAEGYAANAVELGGTSATVEGNAIIAKGNYTAAILSTIPNAVIKNNVIITEGSNVGDEVPGDYYMNKAVIAIKMVSGMADIIDNNISSNVLGVYVAPGTTVTFSDNEVGVCSDENVSSAAIFADYATFNMFNNNITYSAKTVYAGENTTLIKGIFVADSKAAVKGNRFYLNVSSCHVDWPEIPAGSQNWIRTPYSEGISFDSCDNLEFTDNTISLEYNSRSGSDDTIYVLDVVNSDNVTVCGNTIDALGADHVYGIVVENANNFTISTNDIDVSSDVHQAVGIDVEGPAVGVVQYNNITANGTLVNAVYSGMNWKSATVSIENNNIYAEGYAANAVELGGTSATVEGNAIIAKGNYTAAILSTIPNAVIKNNVIITEGSNVGDEVPGDYYMNKAVIAIKMVSGMADIIDNNISSNVLGVYVAPGTTVTFSDNEVGVCSDENVSSAAIFADYATFNMFNNNITYSAKTVYAGENTTLIKGIFVADSKAAVKGNRFYLNVSSCHVDWPEIPAGSQNWIRTPYSEGISFDSCDNLEFTDNTISLEYNSRSGSDDTIYVLDVVNSDNVTVCGNTIDALGADHVYGIVVENANNFTVCDNDINVSSDVHQAIGIDIEGPAVGTVKDNNISASGTLVNAVYSGMNYKPATVSIENNNITAEGYAANAVELGGTSAATVEGNTIVAKGNYTAGIISTVLEAVIRDNVITAEGSNVGNASTGDYLMKKESVGISVAMGNATILENTIVSNGNVSVDLGNTDSIVENNKVIANNTTGDDAISSTGNATIKGNGVVKTVLVGSDASGIYGNVSYSVNLTYENGTAIAGKTIVFTVDNVNFTAVTDAKGVATVNVDTIGKGNHTVVASYAGNGSDVGATTTNVLAISPIASKLEYQKSMTVLITAVKKGSAKYKITLKDVDGKVLAGRDVTVVFNGAKKVLTTDKNGVVNFKLSASKAASYKLTISAADDYYVASPGIATIKINKEATKLTAKKKTFKAKVKTKKYTVTLKDSKKKAIKKVKVTLKVKGKKYTATTNAKGKATFKIKNLKKKGTYAAKVKFAGNALYKAAKKSVKIKVKK